MKSKNRKYLGFGILEVILAMGLWMILATMGVTMTLGSFRLNRLGGEQTSAVQLAAEGIDAVRAMRSQGWNTPFLATNCTAGCGIDSTSGTWVFSGASDVTNKFTRKVFITQSQRDGSGNIVDSGGTSDPETYKVVSQVQWNRGIPPITNTVTRTDYFTNFIKTIANLARGGMIVYGDGGTTSDAIKYKVLSSSGEWSSANPTADVDGATTNKYLRAVKLYASNSRNEKVMVSRHYNGTAQWIYAQVFNGTSWGNVVQLSTWTATTFLDVQNFDGDYLANGDFMVVYSDNTSTPKMRTWNGTTWSAAINLNPVTGNPVHVGVKARVGTNEVMAVFLTSSNNSSSEYYNGTTPYATANWSAVTVHASATITNTKRTIDFHWSKNTPTIGIFNYSSQTNDKKFTAKAFQANGTGGGVWGAASNATNQSNNLGAINSTDRPGANEMNVCNKDGAATPTIVCRTLTFSGTTITWTTPTNPIVSSASDNGIQRSFDLAYESVSGTPVFNFFGDNTTILKYNSYTPATTTWASAATSLMTFDSVPRSVNVYASQTSDDFLVLTGTTNLDLYSFGWNGSAGTIYDHLLGNTSTLTTLDTNSAGIAEAFPYIANSNGTSTKLAVFVNSTNTAPTIHVGIYSDNASHPGSLLGSGSFSPTNGVWNIATISPVTLVSGTKYWIALLGITSGNLIIRDLGTGCTVGTTSENHATTTLTSLPASWTTGSALTTCNVSAYLITNGNTFQIHGVNGSVTTDYWYDFVWDAF